MCLALHAAFFTSSRNVSSHLAMPHVNRIMEIAGGIRLHCYVGCNANIKGDQIEVFKILNGYENIDSNIFFSKLRKVKQLEGTTTRW